MAKKEGGKPRSGKKLLELARQHQDALMAAGLSSTVLDRLETALRGIQSGGQPSPASQVLVKDVQREVGEVQAAIRKEFPNNTSFQAIFKAGEPVPSEPHQVLALGRLVAREAPDYSANLIRYAINAATVKHLSVRSAGKGAGRRRSAGRRAGGGGADPGSGGARLPGEAGTFRFHGIQVTAPKSPHRHRNQRCPST